MIAKDVQMFLNDIIILNSRTSSQTTPVTHTQLPPHHQPSALLSEKQCPCETIDPASSETTFPGSYVLPTFLDSDPVPFSAFVGLDVVHNLKSSPIGPRY